MTDKAHIFFKEGKLYLIPELPVKPRRYQQEYEQAKANALPVVNQKQSDIVEHLPIIRKEGKLYEWPGTWEKVYGIDFGGNDFAFGTGAELIAPQQNTAHGYTEGAEVPQQPQADCYFKVGEKYILDAGYQNSSEITLIAIYGNHYCRVKSEDEIEWDTMLNRLSTIKQL